MYLFISAAKKMPSCWIFDAVGHRTSSMFIRADEHSEFKIISGVSHKYIEQSGGSICRVISEMVINSVLIPRRNYVFILRQGLIK